MRPITSFDEAKIALSRLYDNSRTKYTLDNMRTLMNFLDNPQNKLRVIHVAGTSGKTSTSYYLSALLSASGYKTGLTVSPHVDVISERVQINNEPITELEFCGSLTEFLSLIEDCEVDPSWFETIVAFAYWYFAKQKVDYAVVEAGLGGLKDGTNVVARSDKACVITDIGLDHTGILGNNLSEIAAQKTGIIGDRNAVFTYMQPEAVMKAIESEATKSHGDLHIISEPVTQHSTMPAYQQRNWNLAYEVYKYLQNRDNLQHLTSQALSQTKQIKIPGRMDVRHIGDKTIIMDGAHNVQKMTAFLASFQRLYPDAKPVVLFGVKEGRVYQELVPLIEPIASRVITTSFTSSQDLPVKSMDPNKLAEAFDKKILRVDSIPDQSKAYMTFLDSPEKTGIIIGSFYLLGQIRNNEHLA